MPAQPLAAFAVRFAAGLIPDGTALPILAGPLRGAWWLAGAAPGPSKGLSVLLDRSESGQLAEAARLCRPGLLCLDIGAHAGMYSLLFGRRGARVFAFEPLPANLAWLGRTLRANRLDRLDGPAGGAPVTVVPWALSDREGKTLFREGAHSSEGRLDPAGTRPAYATTCDAFCAFAGIRPDLLKIDVEGEEAAVLRGSAGILGERRPAILLSTHGDLAKEECLRLLRDAGYGKPKPLDAVREADAREFSLTA